MRVSSTRRLCVSLFATLILSGCNKVEFPDITICSVAGIFAAGMNCEATGHDESTQMNAAKMIRWLEGGAVCMSAEDRKKEQIARDQACVKLGAACTYEMKQEFKKADERTEKIRKK